MKVWEGPSALDGSPVFLSLAIGKSNNAKTGNMVQAFIHVANGQHPAENLKTGADYAVCGKCPHRPVNDNVCYASKGTAGMGMVSNWRANHAKPVTPMAGVLNAIKGRDFRMGAYGDPAAVPAHVWQSLVSVCRTVTGYTHQWREPSVNAAEWAPLVMASVDNAAEMRLAHSMGYRTFRVSTVAEPAEDAREIVCPNTTRGIQCADCGLCNGNRGADIANGKGAKSIVIAAHGSGARNFTVR